MSETDQIGGKERPLRVAIIGSGPAGFYAAQTLFKTKDIEVEVDMFDRLPTPYGLVRGGVAPDHQSIKKVVRVYEKTASQPGFRFFGNVTLGQDVEVEDLRQHYDQVVYAVGNDRARRLGIHGEGMWRCTPATVLVGWYNGHPDYRSYRFDLSVRTAAVVGNGNVAVDVARILSHDSRELGETDIADHALQVLRHSALDTVYLLGRRGPVQAAFTPGELKELGQLTDVDPIVDPADLELDPISAEELEGAEGRVKRNFELLKEFSKITPSKKRRIIFRFFVSPTEVVPGVDGGVEAVKLQHNRLVRDGDRVRAEATDKVEELDIGMLLPAVGYRGKPIPGIPFDEERGLITNDNGRVGSAEAKAPNEYVVGWARSGPKGLIGSHKAASAEVVNAMLEDLESGVTAQRALPDREAICKLLDGRGCSYVTFDEWKVIDAVEIDRGKRRDAPRLKVTNVDDMLRVAGKEPPK